MRKRRIIAAAGAVLVCAGMLTGCEIDDDGPQVTTQSNSKSSKDSKNVRDLTWDGDISYEKARKLSNHVYKLLYFENQAISNTNRAYYSLGWYNHDDHVVSARLNSTDDDYKEIISYNIKTPYLYISNDKTFYIHRPPYVVYNQPIIKGKVEAKLK